MADVPKTFDGLRDHVIAPKLAIFLKERECKTPASLSECIDRFLEAQGVTNIGTVADDAEDANKPGAVPQSKQQSICFLCNRKGHKAPECREALGDSQKRKSCGRLGHRTADCKNQTAQQRNVSESISRSAEEEQGAELSKHFSKHYQQCGAKVDIVEKDAGGLAKMGNDGKKAKACSVKEDNKITNEVVMVRGGQRRQPEKRQSCKYGRKCFRRNAQHMKLFSHPKVTRHEAASGDEDENRDEEEFKERVDGRNFANSSDHVNHRVNDSPALRRAKKTTKPSQNESDNEDNGKWDQDDK
ncbi:hypothetical protein MTO96_036293 [Rhipicephalus appendiculatus]